MKELDHFKKKKFIESTQMYGAIFSGLLGMIYGYKAGGIGGAIVGIWIMLVIGGIAFLGIGNLLCNIVEYIDDIIENITIWVIVIIFLAIIGGLLGIKL